MSLPFPHSSRPALALAAVLSVVALVGATEWSMRWRLRDHLEAFGERMSPAKMSGNALDVKAFQTAGILPIFGSSELNRPSGNRPDQFFKLRPFGFAAFPVGRGGNSCLIITQKIAAVGRPVAGKKVAIFLSPTWFIKPEVTLGAVKGNLAPLQLGSWIFSDTLSATLKQRIARRLLDYPPSLADQPLLAMALHSLAEPAPLNHLRLAVMRPLGLTQNFFLQRLDYCALMRETALYQERPEPEEEELGSEPAPGEAIDWDELARLAEGRDRERGNANAYSVGSPTLPKGVVARKGPGKKWRNVPSPTEDDEDEPPPPPRQKTTRNRDPDFLADIAATKEWIDLDLLLSTLKELHADPIFISQPFNGAYRDLNGYTPAGRRAYYNKLHAAIDPFGFPLFDSSEHEEDKYFFNDTGHPSAKAWIYYDHALADFYARKS